uniref:Uncharacterized protein n=1 Tax=Ditylenchus dipsaci TaxID=166011 RepID=A0A915DIN9_9BILA
MDEFQTKNFGFVSKGFWKCDRIFDEEWKSLWHHLVAAIVVVQYLFVVSIQGQCIKSCSDSFRNSLAAIVGSNAVDIDVEMRLLAPFHAVIAHSKSNIVAQRKISWICYSVQKFDGCAHGCVEPESKAKSLRLTNLQQWKSICDASYTHPTAFIDFLRCERAQHEKVAKRCAPLQISSGVSLSDFCKQIQNYSKCYSTVPFTCSPNATQIWSQVNSSVMRSYNLILDISAQHLKIPLECQSQWIPPLHSCQLLLLPLFSTHLQP